MTLSLFNDCILLRNKPLQELVEYLKRVNVSIFDEVIKANCHPHDYHARNIVLFILVAFSEESPMVVARQDRHEEMQNICDFLGIPEFHQENLVHLKDPIIRKATTAYLRQFAGEDYRTLMFLKIQLEDIDLVVTNRDFNIQAGDDKVYIYDQKAAGAATAERARLAKLIIAIENEMRQKIKRIGIENVTQWKDGVKFGSGGRSGAPERLVINKA